MKRSQMKHKLTLLLKNWQSSILDGDTSEEVLKLIEENGMSPPTYKEKRYPARYNGEDVGPTFKTVRGWEEE